MDFITDEQMAQLESEGKATSPDFITDEQMAQLQSPVTPEPISKSESLVRGGLQGLTAGFGDEMAGGLEAGKDVLTTDKTLSDLAALYSQHRDESREANKAAQEANPYSYGAGQVAGGIGTAMLPGLNAMSAAKGAALLGGATGAGLSEAQDVSGLAADTATGAITGGIAGKVLPSLPGVLDKTGAVANQLKETGGNLNLLKLLGLGGAKDVALSGIEKSADVIKRLLQSVPKDLEKSVGGMAAAVTSEANQAPKEIAAKTPEVIRGKMPANYDNQPTESKILMMQRKITPEMGKTGQELNNIFESMKGRDIKSRNAMMFSLEQNPNYRPLLKELK